MHINFIYYISLVFFKKLFRSLRILNKFLWTTETEQNNM